jgi:lysophospholipase L1-like esterase
LRELLTNEGYEVDYVGSSRNGPTGFDGEHVSREGASIAAVEELWAEAGPTLSPHVVLLMAGTNDALGITADQPPEPAARALGALIDRIASDQPDARIVVSTLIPLVQRFWLVGADNAARVPVFNALVEELVAEKRAAGVHVHLADLSGIDGDALGDGIHPSEMATYEEMAELWFPAVVEAIEALREPSS